MTDRELLEMAAKAAGREWLSYHLTKGMCCRDDSYGGLIEYYWNPLTDDGDAMRLAVKLGIDISGVQLKYWDKTSKNPYAATRRAIVLAAAEIGKEIK